MASTTIEFDQNGPRLRFDPDGVDVGVRERRDIRDRFPRGHRGEFHAVTDLAAQQIRAAMTAYLSDGNTVWVTWRQ